MEKYELGLRKKSFSLFYNGGEIWGEHLDALYDQKELLKQKFLEDLEVIRRPSTSAYIAIVMDESDVDIEILDLIINSFTSMNKPLRKVAFIGLKSKMKSYVNKKNAETSFVMSCINDLEKAKEWLI